MALRRRSAHDSTDLFPGFADVYEIGAGSLAAVFRAREVDTNRLVALKLLNVRDASERSIESFERESIALGALSSHPNIVTLYRTFRTPDGRPVLVLELCSGAVADRLRDGAGLPVPDVVSVGIKIAAALETAHRVGILHRDVKPQNILVTEFGEPALADFGVAMMQSSSQTTAGLFDFTTLHAAPELLEGAGTSAATDVYELASTLYQLIAGQSAFRAYEGESPASVILRILRDPVRPLSGTDVPVALSDLLIRAMAKQMHDRPPTAARFADELAAVEAAQGWPPTRLLLRGPATAVPPPLAPPPSVSVPPAASVPPRPLQVPTPPPVPPPPAALPPPPAPRPVPAPAPPDAVPVWAVRSAEPGPPPSFAAPQFVTDASLDPGSLRRRTVARSRAGTTVADDDGLTVRTRWRRTTLRWVDVRGVEVRTDAGPDTGRNTARNPRQVTGRLVALTADGPVDLPGTRRSYPEARTLQVVFEAYRTRAGRAGR